MHIQKHFAETRTAELYELIRNYPLATFITSRDGNVVANHMPFILVICEGEKAILQAHIPRANPVWEAFDQHTEAVAVFQGPNAYISPTWYPSKNTDAKVVPTWNYVAVHARGCPRPVRDPAWLLKHLNALTEMHESTRNPRWRISDAPQEYIEKMMQHIVGIELPIASLEGKWKVSQNRPEVDRTEVAARLQDQGDNNSAGNYSRAMADLVLRGSAKTHKAS